MFGHERLDVYKISLQSNMSKRGYSVREGQEEYVFDYEYDGDNDGEIG
jgi:hypothetical protein